jgi:integrase
MERASKAFTVTRLDALKPRGTRYIEWDPAHAGFGLRVSPHGHKAFIYAYRFDGRFRMKTLGSYGAPGGLTLKAALSRYLADAAKVERAADVRAHGEAPPLELDPGAEKVTKAKAYRAADSVSEAAEKYLTAMEGELRQRTIAEYRRVLETYLLPRYGNAKPGSVKKRDLAALLDAIAAGEFRSSGNGKRKQSKTMAERAKSVLAAFFKWLASRDLIDAVPTVHLDQYQKSVKRDRYLSDAEAGRFFSAADEMKASDPVKAALKIALLTGQRIGEVQRLRWSDVAGEWWTIPAELTKNKRKHRVYLSEMGRAIIMAMPKVPGGEYIFPGVALREPMSLQACGKAVARNLATFKKHSIQPFTPHALRHTVRTGLSALRTRPEVKDAVLNHSDGSVGGRYDHHKYDDEKREALTAWERHLMSLMGKTSPNIIEMGRAAA